MAESRANLAWHLLLSLDGPGSLHERLAAALRQAVRQGTIPAGGALPPSRQFAEELGCSRWVVTEAYAQLAAEGYVEARTGSATRVRRVDPLAPEPTQRRSPVATEQLVDLAPGLPDLRAFPRSRWLNAVRAEAAALPYDALSYPPPQGCRQLREVLADYLGRCRGAVVRPDHLVVCRGVVDGMVRVCRALRGAGIVRIGVEEPGWPRLRAAAESAGLEPVAIPVDGDGLVVERLSAHPDVRAVITAPAHQFPTGRVLAPQRRQAQLAWARDVDGLICEDDYDAEFRYDRKPVGTVQGMDPGRVALFGSVSKTLSPALGLGWFAAPPRWVEAVQAADPTALSPPVLDQHALARFVTSGAYDRHLRAARRRYQQRRETLLAALRRNLPQCPVTGIAAGLHAVLHLDLDRHPPPAQVVRDAAREGVRVANLDGYRRHPDPVAPGLVLGYGNLADSMVERAVDRLAGVLGAGVGQKTPSRPVRTPPM